MTEFERTGVPDVRSLSVLAYELNSLALAAAAEAATLARGGAGDAADGDEALADELNDLIRRLQRGTRAMRLARRRGDISRG
jgi:hypothetical protein